NERTELVLHPVVYRRRRKAVFQPQNWPVGYCNEAGSLTIRSNSCSQLCSWHLNSSTFTGIRTCSVRRSSSGISSYSSLVCRSIAVPPHSGQVVNCRSIDASEEVKDFRLER